MKIRALSVIPTAKEFRSLLKRTGVLNKLIAYGTIQLLIKK